MVVLKIQWDNIYKMLDAKETLLTLFALWLLWSFVLWLVIEVSVFKVVSSLQVGVTCRSIYYCILCKYCAYYISLNIVQFDVFLFGIYGSLSLCIISPLLDETKWIHFPTLYLFFKLLSFYWSGIRLQLADWNLKGFRVKSELWMIWKQYVHVL